MTFCKLCIYDQPTRMTKGYFCLTFTHFVSNQRFILFLIGIPVLVSQIFPISIAGRLIDDLSRFF